MFQSHSDHLQGARISLIKVTPNRTHVHTPYVMLPHHHTNFLHF